MLRGCCTIQTRTREKGEPLAAGERSEGDVRSKRRRGDFGTARPLALIQNSRNVVVSQRERERERECAREGTRDERNGDREGRKDNAPAIKLSRLTPWIKRPQRTLGSVTKLLEYFASLKRGRLEGPDRRVYWNRLDRRIP